MLVYDRKVVTTVMDDDWVPRHSGSRWEPLLTEQLAPPQDAVRALGPQSRRRRTRSLVAAVLSLTALGTAAGGLGTASVQDRPTAEASGTQVPGSGPTS